MNIAPREARGLKHRGSAGGPQSRQVAPRRRVDRNDLDERKLKTIAWT